MTEPAVPANAPATPDATATPPATPAGANKATPNPSTEPPVIPETYDLKLPDGSKLDPARVTAIASQAKEAKLSNEAAQAILQREHEAVDGYAKAQADAYAKQQEAWVIELKNDKVLGGENFNKTAETAKRVVDQFGDADFKQSLNDSGLGNHPGLIRFIAKIASAMGDDTLVQAGAAPAGGGQKDLRDVFYPKPQK